MLASMIKLTFLALKTPTIPSHLSFHQLNALLHWKLKRLVQDVEDFKIPTLVELSSRNPDRENHQTNNFPVKCIQTANFSDKPTIQ